MASTDIELKQQLKEAGRLLSRPSDSVDELLYVLDQVEKLLSMVDQSPNDSMLEVLNPSMRALVSEGLLRHSDSDVKVAVTACISEITRITAPDAPYNDEEMRNVFHLIVSSFENFFDKSSRSYDKRVSILETVSKVRSCVIMLDLECDRLIVEMFEHFLKSVRDHHPESILSSMENIMVLVLDESEDITLDMLKSLLASVKNNSEGVLPVARKLGEGVLQKSATKLRPYLIPALRSLGDSLDNYSQVVASICEGTNGAVEHNDENASWPQPSVESKLAKGSSDQAPQADESKLTTASSDDVPQVVKENSERPFHGEIDPALDSLKLVMSNEITVAANEDASADHESSKNPEEIISQPESNLASKTGTVDSVAEMLVKAESKPEQATKGRGKKSGRTINSAETSDSSHVDNEKEAEKLPNNQRINGKDVCNSPGKESSIEAVIPSEIEKDTDIPVSSPKAIDSPVANAPSPSQNGSLPDASYVKKAGLSKKQHVLPQQEELEVTNPACPPQSVSLPFENRSKQAGRLKNESLNQDDAPSTDVSTKGPEGTRDMDIKPQRRAGKKVPVAKEEDKLPAPIPTSEDGEATSGSDDKLLKTSSKKVDGINSGSKSAKQLGKKVGAGDSEAKKPKQSGKKVGAGESEAKKPKQADKKVDVGVAVGRSSSQSLMKEDESDSDAKLLRQPDNKGEKSRVETNPSRHTTKKEEGSDSETKSVKLSAKKGNASNSLEVKSSSKKKNDRTKPGRDKAVIVGDHVKSLFEDDMDISPKSGRKSAKGKGDLSVTAATTSKRKRATTKDTVLTPSSQVSETINLDESLVGLKVKVWWPKDKMFYEGVIHSFDSTKMRHKVLYVDGDEENLNLKRQKWKILQDFSAPDEVQGTEAQSVDGSPETHKKKKLKTNLEPSTPQEKRKGSAKRAGGKSKGLVSRSARSSKGEGKDDNKSMDTCASKSIDGATSKEAETSNEEEEMQKVSKGKSGSKGNGNGSLNMDGEGKTPESAKGKSKAVSKGRKKRKRRF